MKKSGSKILGIAAAIAVIVYWGNSIFGGKYSSSSKKTSSQSTYINPGNIYACTSQDGKAIAELSIYANYDKPPKATTMSMGGIHMPMTNFSQSSAMYSSFYYDNENQKWSLRINRKTGDYTLSLDNYTEAGRCVK